MIAIYLRLAAEAVAVTLFLATLFMWVLIAGGRL